MWPRIRPYLRMFKAAFDDWRKDKASNHAAALAYYTVFSLAPLLVIATAVAGLVFDQAQVRGLVLTQARDLAGDSGAAMLSAMMAAASKPRSTVIATIIGVVTLLVGATAVFGHLQEALNAIWGVEARKQRKGMRAFVRRRIASFGMVVVIGFLLVVSLVLSAIISGAGDVVLGGMPAALAQAINVVVSFAVNTLLFAAIFKVLPDVKIRWREVWFGAAVTALLFGVGRYLIGLYLGRSAVGSAYGAAGALVLILLWIYYTAQILFFGAELTEVWARRRKPLAPAQPLQTV